MDCDCDGTTSGTIMVRYLKNFTDKVSYIFSQRSQGHGIKEQVVPKDCDLLIIVDSSTNDTEKCKELNEKGLDILILDHHLKEKENPYAIIVNPQLDNYPNKELSGAGVVFKTCQVLDDLLDTNYSINYLDLCGIGLVADIMSMKEPENRYLVYQALHNINNSGIMAILKKQNIDINNNYFNPDDIDSSTIGFKIAPVINACCRADRVELVIKLLLEDDYEECLVLAKECIGLNNERKNKETKYFKKVKGKIDNSHKAIILITDEKDKIDKGYQGLLAMKIADYYKKPTLVVKNKDNICSGSGRGIDDVEFKPLLEKTKLFNWLQGHNNAFGCSFNYNNLDNIHKILDKIINKKEDKKIIEYDIELNKDNIDLDIVKQIEQFNYISGKEVKNTKVLIRQLPVIERRVLGKNFDTIKIQSEGIDLMKFKVNEFYGEELYRGDCIDVIGSLNINKWFNFGIRKWIINAQCFIDDYKLSDEII